MSLEGDQIVFENSVANNSEPVLFEEKKYNFITDSTSVSGSFQSGQINFDLSTFSSQNWVSLSEAVIEFPLKITARLTTPATGTGTAPTQSAGILSAICKNGFHQWINAAQLIINGQSIQSQQPMESVASTYRILSSWSQDTLNKWGDSCGIALDDCSADAEVSTTYANNIGLANAAESSILKANRGADTTNNQSILFNKGTSTRAQLLNCNNANTTLGVKLLGSYKNAGKANVTSASASNVLNTLLYSQCIMATVRVKDLFDIDEFPLVKNIKGYMYLNFNSTEVRLSATGTATGAIGIDDVSVSIVQQTGNVCPFTLNYSATGIQLNNFPTTNTQNPVLTILGTVNSSDSDLVSGTQPLLSTARLVMPYYNANPNTDSALAKVQRFKTLEKIVNPFTISAGSTTNFTITVGVPNPRKLVLLPMWQNAGGYSLANPELSCFDQTPATSGIFAKLDNIQVYVANKPLFQYPIQYDYEYWVANHVELGANAGLTNEMTSGLLSQQLWEQNHRYYVFDLARRMKSDNGMSRSVQITATNPNSNLSMKVIAILFYEKEFEINTATCQIMGV